MLMKRLYVCLLLSINSLVLGLEGKVDSIVDGDTLTVLTADKQRVKVRLSGIDAPERKQAFGTKAGSQL